MQAENIATDNGKSIGRNKAPDAVAEGLGQEMFALIARLYPLCRSITGAGVRDTLAIVKEYIPLEVHEVPTGTAVFDWTVPREWNIRDAYVKDRNGVRVIDFKKHNLHVVGYSVPVHRTMPLAELKPHLFSVPEQPDWIPYRTSYYHESWGFCVTHNQLLGLVDGDYEVCIDATLAPGSLTYGEYFVPGEIEDEVLFFAHTCHPSLCNDNLSGIVLAACLARHLRSIKPRYTYRFVFAPSTIGSITWLSINAARLQRIKHGLIMAVLGDAGNMTYKKSRRGDAVIDRAVQHVLYHKREPYNVLEFLPHGYDERQFCSPGINLPMGRLTRSPNGGYPEYHTSADNLDLISPAALQDSFSTYTAVIAVLERNRRYVNLNPMCEPQLGRRGLYRKTGSYKDVGAREHALLWVLNLSDGEHTLLDIAERAGLCFDIVAAAADDLHACGLLREIHSHEGAI